MSSTRIVIVGGGFAGVKCAQTLRRHLAPQECEIVLLDSENHLVFSPLLAEVAGSLLNADAASAPLRQLVPSVKCRREQVRQIDLEKRLVDHQSEGCAISSLEYDHLVIACGRTVNLTQVPGLADHALPLMKVGDALQLRSRIIQQLEKADVLSDPALRRHELSFIVGGGGFSGVEVAGEINDLVRESLRYYPHISNEDVRVTIIHSHNQILPEVSPPLREFAREKMEERQIHFVLNARIAMVTSDGVRLADGTLIRGATVVSTIGSAPSPLILNLDAARENGFLLTEPDMRLKGKSNVWAIGDCARIMNTADQKPSPATGQFAERQGRQAAENIVRVIRKKPTRPFYYRNLGQLCSIGGRSAVAEIRGFRLSGFLAWFVWRGVYLFKMPTWARRIKIGIEWAWDLLFGRDLTSVAPDLTKRLATATYNTGDIIFRKDEPATHLYAIESGEVEVFEGERVIAVYSAGDFFGERSLLEQRAHQRSARARTLAHILVMGSEVLSQLSEAVSPLRRLLLQTAALRETDVLRRFPELRQAFEQRPVRDFVESLPGTLLHEDQTFGDALNVFNRGVARYAAVLNKDEILVGIVALTDLFRATAGGAHPGTPIQDVMARGPACVSQNDSPELVVRTLRDRNLKWLPVVESSHRRRFVGWIRGQTLLEQAFKERSYVDARTR